MKEQADAQHGRDTHELGLIHICALALLRPADIELLHVVQLASCRHLNLLSSQGFAPRRSTPLQ